MTSIVIDALPESIDMVTGKYPPQRIKTEEQDSINILVKSDDRTYGNDYNFQSDLLTSTSNIRKIKLAKAFVPLPPQINIHNRSITVTHTDGDVTFSLLDGYYSVQSLVNMMQAAFTDAWVSLDPTNSVTISYDVDRRTIEIIDDNAEQFYIHNTSPFALYAINVVNFPTQAPLSALSTDSIESKSLGMIYSRFYILSSQRLTEDQGSFSAISSGGASNIVAILDLASSYNSAQFSVSTSFPGTEVVVDTLSYAPNINMVNRNKSLKVFDLALVDEFGFGLETIDNELFNFEHSTAMWFQAYI